MSVECDNTHTSRNWGVLDMCLSYKHNPTSKFSDFYVKAAQGGYPIYSRVSTTR
jgi:hypothetical protein